jgi:RNA polymerase sigma-70 factor (ECF subfamily)
MLKDGALAHDAAQHTFLALWEQRRRYRPLGRFRELLFTIARNEARRLSRRRRVLSLFGLVPPGRLEPVAEAHADNLEPMQNAALVRSAMERLPEHFRVPLALRFVEGLSHEEIAAVIGRTSSAARSRVHYGLKALAELLPKELTP